MGKETNTEDKSLFFSKEWWYGIFGNILATVIGIALTFGVTAILDAKQQKQNIRQVMLCSIRTVEADCAALEIEDSVYQSHYYACERLTNLYNEYKGNLSLAPEDSLIKYMNFITNLRLESKRGNAEQIFFNANVLQQFQNPETYQYFASILQFDKETFETIKALHAHSMDVIRIAIIKKYTDGKPSHKTVEELIREHVIPDYSFAILTADIKHRRKLLLSGHTRMLQLAGISKEEYLQYTELKPEEN